MSSALMTVPRGQWAVRFRNQAFRRVALSMVAMAAVLGLGLLAQPGGWVGYLLLLAIWVIFWWPNIGGYVELRDELLVRRCWRRRTVPRSAIWRVDLIKGGEPRLVLNDRRRFALRPLQAPFWGAAWGYGVREADALGASFNDWIASD